MPLKSFKIVNVILSEHKPRAQAKLVKKINKTYRTIKCEKNILVLIPYNSPKETQQLIALLGNTEHLLIPSKIRRCLNSKETKTGCYGKFCIKNKIFRGWLVLTWTNTHNLALVRI